MAAPEFLNNNGRALTKSLFFELSDGDKIGACYTLKDRDHEVDGVMYESLYLKYMETADPTEYTFANKYLAGWNQWQMICNATWFKEYLDRWRWELELKLRAEALQRIIDVSRQSENRNSFSAAKFLVDSGWMTKEQTKNPVGRPTAERIKKEAENLRRLEQEILEDHERIN